MDLLLYVYCSAASADRWDASELSALLETCRINNAKCDVTGMLLFQNRSFFQVLEGERRTVEALFEKVSADPRHTRVTRVIAEPIIERAFATWSMGFPRVTEQDLAAIPGLNDFFGRATSYVELGEGRAKTLLNAFKGGRWRMNLS